MIYSFFIPVQVPRLIKVTIIPRDRASKIGTAKWYFLKRKEKNRDNHRKQKAKARRERVWVSNELNILPRENIKFTNCIWMYGKQNTVTVITQRNIPRG